MSQTQTSSRGRRVLRGVVAGAAVLGLLLVALSAWVWFAPCWLGGCAPVEQMARFQAEGSQLLDVNGEQFATLAVENRRIVPIDSLPPHLPQAFLAVEDQRFYRHWGLDLQRVAGAALSNVRAGGVAEGGSTITMQLARNLFPDQLPYQERSFRRKIMEARIARQIEQTFPKDKILELYMNHIYLGAGAYGVEAAAQTYFGKPAAEVTLAEAAVLGALPKAPSTLDPTRNPDRALERRNLVLREMARAGFVSPAQATDAREQPLQLSESGRYNANMEGSYFVERVRRELQEVVGSRIFSAGLRVYTTLDPNAQAAAEEELSNQLDAIESGRFGAFRHTRFEEARGNSEAAGTTPYLQGMVVVLEAETGEVRALVGGRDWNDSKFDRATQALRQPGSAFKPFIYLAALERFSSPVHQVEDTPLRLTLSGGRVWEPRNYGDRYDGTLTMREALTRSKNTATVRLAQEVGMSSAIRSARELGISNDIPELPSTALGAAEVRPLELVAAYAAFSNGGQRVQPHFVRRIEDRNGRLVWEASPERRRVIDPAAAFVLTTMLRDVVDRGTGTAVRSAGFNGPAAGKTGTTNDAADVWFVGYTPDLVAGVWIGLDDPQPIIRGASGGTLAAPVWGRIMSRIYQNRSMPEGWQQPSGVVTEEVERGTGIVVSEWCPAQGATYTEYFVRSVPNRGVCPRQEGIYAGANRNADSLFIWGDEEWDTEAEPADRLAERGIFWPELEELRREREERTTDLPGTPVRTETERRTTADRDGQSSNDRSATRDTPAAQPAPVRERDLPGTPIRRPEPPRTPDLPGQPVRQAEPDTSGLPGRPVRPDPTEPDGRL